MPVEYQTYKMTWRGLIIEARYCFAYANTIAHLAIERDYGDDVVAAVIGWLDAEAENPEWKKQEESGKQGDLFAL